MAQHLPPNSTVAKNLALAVVVASNAPVLLLDEGLVVVAASLSFCESFQIDPVTVSGCHLTELGSGEWAVPQLASLLKATYAGTAKIVAYEMDLKRNGKGLRRLVLNAQLLDYSESGESLMLLSVADVTEARLSEKLKDDLLREKAVLMQELQHRVANSLQIIASVLLQSARKIQSDETRVHLHDAHSRIMSVAALQRQLAVSNEGQVALRAYFTELCTSLGASMIRDHNQIELTVHADASVISADVSVSLGLIVTELVINALKHAFPQQRVGEVTVAYQAEGQDWRLSVADNGVGIAAASASTKAGLGTSLVKALAQHLDADVTVADNHPGTTVSITHDEKAMEAKQAKIHPAV